MASVSERLRQAVGSRPNPDVVAKPLGLIAVLVNIHTSRIFELDQRVCELVGQGVGSSEIVSRLGASTSLGMTDGGI